MEKSETKERRECMDWKREAADKLKDYEARRQALVNLSEEIERLKAAMSGIRSANSEVAPARGNGRREDALLSNLVHRQELELRLEDARLWVSMVERALSVLDQEERLILEGLFVNKSKGSVDRLCERLNVEKTAVYERKDKALRHFTLALYGATEA